ncbi:MAG: tetratricopeptide repeat protein [Burkholderiales bacterium]|nr:tetratricopeptide repeat protein [Burkholderiales bacterium]MDE1928282.1 tetratricopeptide repeat protein [Burkholderiales bacterium]MDE2159154.1 tetratricopeptide repeat protein [Burkholderiales bacterium]MDE2501460.1 tetratricopeptide repeat protein [Burkholderiales bacterium]
MSDRFRPPRPLRHAAGFALAALLAQPAAQAAAPAAPAAAVPAATAASAAAKPRIVNSELDGRLLYELLVGEMALNDGDTGGAYELILDAARRTRDETLFRRAVDIALQARAGDKALDAVRAWHDARPSSLEPLRLQLQIVLLLNRPAALAEPLKALLAQTPVIELPGLISALPRLLQSTTDKKAAALVVQQQLEPYRRQPDTRVAALVAQGRCWLLAKDAERALALAREAHAADPKSADAAGLALELMHDKPEAEALARETLERPGADPALRLAYARVLTQSQRYADAVTQLEAVTRAQPDLAPPFLTLGALELELEHPKRGEAALLHYLDLVQKPAATPAAAAAASMPASAAAGEPAPAAAAQADAGQIQAWLMLAQSAEQRGDYAAAERWLAHVDDPQRALEVQTRRASILVRQGKLAQALELVRQVPEHKPDDARAKLLAEAGLQRDAKDWQGAFDTLAQANQRFADDTDLLYEQAMMAEKINRLDEMERLLRRVIELQPGNAQAHNALGYALADRGLRLPEARTEIQRALDLAPGDPYITDSLGWVEFRLGHLEQAATLLQRAYAARPDPEIGAHLGEVLWALGRRIEARKVWTEARALDHDNDVLHETLTRLHVSL